MQSCAVTIAESFVKNSSRVFLIDAASGRSLTYGEFESLAMTVGSNLAEHGLTSQDRVIVASENSVEMAATFFACLIHGFVIIPISPGVHARDLAHILAVSKPHLAVLSKLIELPIAIDECKTVALESLLNKDNEQLSNSSSVLQDRRNRDLFSITFTSGTTSKPKGVVHCLEGLVRSAEAFNKANGFDESSRFLHVLSMSYMAGLLNTLLCPFMAGGSVVCEELFTARLALSFWNNAIKYEVNTFWIVPTIAMSLVRINRDPRARSYCLEQVRRVCIGTAPLTTQLWTDFYEKYGVKLSESYGLSELLFISSNRSGESIVPGSVGHPVGEAKIGIAQGNNITAPVNVEGEIVVKTPYAMLGYLVDNSKEFSFEPAPTIKDGWAQTGDVGKLNATGDLVITGRSKDLIIKGGLNVSPRAIEEVIATHAGVAEVAVVGIAHKFYGEDIVAVVRLHSDESSERELAEIMTLCKSTLPETTQPAKILAWNELPKGATGKVQKAKIREIVGSGTIS